MKTFLRIIAGLIVLGLVVLALFVFWPLDRTQADEIALGDDAMAWPGIDDAARPHAAAVAADCIACHTAEDGKDFAGGYAFETPFGTIYSSNITPDEETGIGDYTLDEFRAALVDGIRKDGAHLYPAMPYANYRKMSERDVEALYSYFMDEVTPVSTEEPPNEMTFPFNLRFGVRAWKWLALPGPGFTGPEDGVLARGAYLVEGPEHCGACHSPRNAAYIQKGYDASDDAFLAGGEIEGWPVPSLRGEDGAPARWSEDALRAYLTTGRNNTSATAGEMTRVIAHSLQHLPQSDLDAVLAYLRNMAPNGGGAEESGAETTTTIYDIGEGGGTTEMLASADPDRLGLGGRLYLDNCSACHMIDGKGADRVFPELDGNTTVTADAPTGLLSVILNGAELPSTGQAPMRLQMPGFADRLDDAEVAALASFLRGAWSNDAGEVEAEAVKSARN